MRYQRGNEAMMKGEAMAKGKKESIQARGSVFGVLCAFLFLVSMPAHANPPAQRPVAPAKKAAPADPKKGFRKKELSFEERVIEGLSNRGYDSLSQSGSADGLKGEKLYRKRAEFDDDSKSMLREMEYLK
jgi:hypothetical protein